MFSILSIMRNITNFRRNWGSEAKKVSHTSGKYGHHSTSC